MNTPPLPGPEARSSASSPAPVPQTGHPRIMIRHNARRVMSKQKKLMLGVDNRALRMTA